MTSSRASAATKACVGGLNLRPRTTCVVNVGAGRRAHPRRSQPCAEWRRPLAGWSSWGRSRRTGGGPAGFWQLAGHHVVLYEAADEGLGGQLRLARHSPMRSEIAKLIPYYERQSRRTGVDVRLGVEIGLRQMTARLTSGPGCVSPRPARCLGLDGYQTWHPTGPPLGWGDSATVCTGWDILAGRRARPYRARDRRDRSLRGDRRRRKAFVAGATTCVAL